jgi:hypothetical protein
MNENYGKITNSNFDFAPRILAIGNKRIINPKEKHFLQAGYKKIIKTEMPIKDGYFYVPKYTDQGDSIIQEWIEYATENKRDFTQA